MASNPPQKWPGRQRLSSFVRILHLLNLDLRNDWPGINEQTFAGKSSLQQRTKCVEWSLYQLFLLYDKALTQEKLKPFFPPSTYLQSMNLRAALLRQLTDLKKSGILGQHTQLRKTMLDECKGEKFEEVLAEFAMIVLKKNFKEHVPASDNLDEATALSLILAYRSSLRNNLQERGSIRNQCLMVHSKLEEANSTLEQQKSVHRDHKRYLEANDAASLENLVRSEWVGDQNWGDIITGGLPFLSHIIDPATLLKNEHDGPTSKMRHESCIQELESQTLRHQSRLKDWEGILEEIRREVLENETSVPSQPTDDLPRRLSYDMHTTLQPSTHEQRKIQDGEQLHLDYSSLLRSMDQELQIETTQTQSKNVDRFKVTSESIQLVANVVPTSSSDSGGSLIGSLADEITSHKATPTTGMVYGCRGLSDGFGSHEDSLAEVDYNKLHRSSVPRWPNKSVTRSEKNELEESTKQRLVMIPNNLYAKTEDVATVENVGTVKNNVNLQNSGDQSPIEAQLTSESPLSLVERTRQSMSMLSANYASSSARRQTQRSSVQGRNTPNPFETPKSKYPSMQSALSPGSGTSTPKERLFEEGADYDSVFKSRPRLAASPSLTPSHNDTVEDSILGVV